MIGIYHELYRTLCLGTYAELHRGLWIGVYYELHRSLWGPRPLRVRPLGCRAFRLWGFSLMVLGSFTHTFRVRDLGLGLFTSLRVTPLLSVLRSFAHASRVDLGF